MKHLFLSMDRKHQMLAPFILRLIIGFGFIAHGWAKYSRGTTGFEKLLTFLHVPFPHLMATITPAIEVIGGLAIFIGAFVSLAAIPLILTMLTAMFTIHIHYGFSSVKTIGLTPEGPQFGPPGYEINLLYIAGLIAIMITGAGRFSIHALLAKKRHK